MFSIHLPIVWLPPSPIKTLRTTPAALQVDDDPDRDPRLQTR